MTGTMSQNFFVGPAGAPYFLIGSNLAPSFEFGSRQLFGPWLRGEFAGDPPEPVFNGRLFLPHFSEPGLIIDTFPKGPAPDGWFQRRQPHVVGYELRRKADESLIFGFEFRKGICRITTDLLDGKGNVVAKALSDRLEVVIGPFRIPGLLSVS